MWSILLLQFTIDVANASAGRGISLFLSVEQTSGEEVWISVDGDFAERPSVLPRTLDFAGKNTSRPETNSSIMTGCSNCFSNRMAVA